MSRYIVIDKEQVGSATIAALIKFLQREYIHTTDSIPAQSTLTKETIDHIHESIEVKDIGNIYEYRACLRLTAIAQCRNETEGNEQIIRQMTGLLSDLFES